MQEGGFSAEWLSQRASVLKIRPPLPRPVRLEHLDIVKPVALPLRAACPCWPYSINDSTGAPGYRYDSVLHVSHGSATKGLDYAMVSKAVGTLHESFHKSWNYIINNSIVGPEG
jgi:hypothetical protein